MRIEKIDEKKYTSKDYSMSVKKANLYSTLTVLPIYALYMIFYLLRWNYANIFATLFKWTFLLELFILALEVIAAQIIALIIKGMMLSGFSESSKEKTNNLKFKLLAENQKPYVALKEPITVSQFRLCQFIYILFFAVVPFAIAMMIGDFMFVLSSFICVLIAGSDILLLFHMLKHKSDSYIIDYDGLFLYKIYAKK